MNAINLDLFSVGIVVAAIGILGFVVFSSNRKSITTRNFLIFALLTIFYLIANYSAYQVTSSQLSLMLFRTAIFFGVWHAFYIFRLLYVFPQESFNFPNWYKFILLPLVGVSSILNLTPFVFSEVGEVSSAGRVTEIINGPGIALFGALVFFLIITGVISLIRKILRASGLEKIQFRYTLIGTLLTFFLVIAFSFILPAFFDNSSFISFGPAFFFPFIAFTAYAIFKHHLLDVKVIATEVLTFVLAIAALYEVVFAEEITILILRAGVFLLILSFGILLIRSVRREVEQRERLQKLTEQLQAANVKLKELDQIKSEFLSFASHQVKSPMAVVKGYATLIADGTFDPVSDKAKETAGKIKAAADRLIALVNNLLDLRKIEEGKMDFKFEQVDIADMVWAMTEEYQVIGREKGLAVSFESDIKSFSIKADGEKIRQVIQNIIDNSIKYTPKGFVKVGFRDEGETVLISVTDSGQGISKDLQEKLFQQFVRDEKTKDEIKGTGLGLYIAKQIVEAHKGKIWVESEGEGKGSQFYVRLSKE